MSSSPPRETVLSTSPSSIGRGSPTLLRRGSVSRSDISELAARPRLSPTLIRSFDPNDPEVRERQRTLDVDMALQLSRARRETITSIPSGSIHESAVHSHHLDTTFPSLSPREQHEVDIARGEVLHPADIENSDGIHIHSHVHPHVPHLHQMHDPALLVSSSHGHRVDIEDPSSPTFGLPTYQQNVSQSNFNFTLMEHFAVVEKTKLGITPGSDSTGIAFKLRNPNLNDTVEPQDGPSDPSIASRVRQRKLSQSNPNPRSHRKGIGGKMALFESNPSLSGRLQGLGSAVPPYSTIVDGANGSEYFAPGSPSNVASAPGLDGAPNIGILNTGHDRPYRFSFYSNALSATIHARSLSELPAEGQSFEQLFSGMASTHDDRSPQQPAKSRQVFSPVPVSANHPGAFNPADNLKQGAYDSQEQGSALKPIGSSNSISGNLYSPTKNGDRKNAPGMIGNNGDFEGNTWWLDVQNPTDEEMKMLSKVFSIHPLTTEDIQMEETREKIELFRNYYLVCFRSFDQDPYSPTHLEPLNMYIIVFREGILSFHFRSTPHPQNVRRRIKQLKDYISVTSDWISYALIDDITDAFGPLIQSIEYEVDSIDELVLILKEAEQSDMLRRIGTCRKKVMGLLRLMGNKADVVKGLAKRCNENWRVAPTSDIGLYLSDIQDHLITMTQNLNHYEKILSRSHSNYLAQISIEMTDANNQINDVLSKLTALGTVLIPMNLVTGLWGMNVHVPGQGGEDLTWFVSIIAGLAAFALIGGYSTYKFMVSR